MKTEGAEAAGLASNGRKVLVLGGTGAMGVYLVAERRTWGEIAGYYRDLIGLDYVAVPTEEYVRILGGSPGIRYQLAYDRLFDRVIDNSKILRVAGLKHADFMPLRSGLERELTALPKDATWPDASAVWERMDAYLKV